MERKKQIDLVALENQIDTEQRSVKYDTREFTIEYYVNKYKEGEENDKNELFVPDYQREFVWDDNRQSRFIESLVLGLPVPLIFVAEDKDGRLEIVDGSQRIRTLNAFLGDELELSGLKKLTRLNGLKFSQLSSSLKRKIKNIPMRMIVLNTQTTQEVRNEIFDRINTSGLSLVPMEARRGIYKGRFTDFVTRLAETEKFKKLCPLIGYVVNRREEEEMVLRFFAFSDTYPEFSITGVASLKNDGVAEFLNKYIDYKNKNISDDELIEKEKAFNRMVDFIDREYPEQGFAKRKNVPGVSKPYFEAIAVGAHFALEEKGDLVITSTDWSVVDKNKPNEFYRLLSSRYRTHTPEKLKSRIEYAKKHFIDGK